MDRGIENITNGGGQAGLATGYHLQKHGAAYVILDKHPEVGASWRSRWDSLKLFTPNCYHNLPGMRFPGSSRSYSGIDEAMKMKAMLNKIISTLTIYTMNRKVITQHLNGYVTICLISFVYSVLSPKLFAQDRPPIIDMHLHADLPPLEVSPGSPAICRPEPCSGQGQATANHTETMEMTLEIMDRHNIVKAFLSGIDPAIVQQWVDAAPGRFIAAPFIFKPGHPDTESLRRSYEDDQYSGMGEIATQLSGIKPNDPTLEPYFALAEELDLPVLIHTEGIGPYLPEFRCSAGSPLLLEDVLVRHPKLRLFVENAGYPYRDEMIAVMSQYPQLYADISTITWVIPQTAFHDYLKALVRAGLGKRLMFGSDQMRWPEMIEKGIESIENADFLTEDQKRDIFYHNALRFLKLDSQPHHVGELK